jgi:ubiquinone/menaquinone biosynthesis C-methylase UbiE
MPTIEENLNQWTSWDWTGRGDEWSRAWGGTENLWFGSLLPRLKNLLPVGALTEIAPGFGRITQFLKDQCTSMTLVDLTPRCIDGCRIRFAGEKHLSFIVNDGRSLPGIDDHSMDFVFSFDSLVHAELDVMQGYISELGRVLRPEGSAFIHHSNVAAFKRPDGDGITIENKHWRGTTVSANLVNQQCEDLSLVCYRQEIVNWGGNSLTDCFSYVARRGSARDCGREVVENSTFMEEAVRIRQCGWRSAGA